MNLSLGWAGNPAGNGAEHLTQVGSWGNLGSKFLTGYT